jgi:5'-nucleotidase
MIKNRPLILVTNDDGVYAPGIKHLWKSLSSYADLVVVAPAEEQSAVSLSITIRRPLHIEKIEWSILEAQVWSINGTPADCVKLALNVILPRQPDLIVSGINRGTNAGRNVLYSGTVAAIIEGVMHQIPGIAFSLGDFSDPDYEPLKPHIFPIVDYVLQNKLPTGTLLNVNFPKQAAGGLKGIRFACQGKEYWAENPECRHHPAEGKRYYWLGARLNQTEEEDPTSDIMLLREGYATIVPLLVGNLTHQKYLDEQQEHFNQFLMQSQACVP